MKNVARTFGTDFLTDETQLNLVSIAYIVDRFKQIVY